MMQFHKRMQGGMFPSPWIVVAAAGILLLVVITLAVRNINREKLHMSRMLIEKGAALIKAFEAGTRTGMMGMMWGGQQVQRLLEETARQPDILYLMVVDREGRVLAHNDRSQIGSRLETMPPAGNEERWRLTNLPDGRQAFEIYRLFKPLRGGNVGNRSRMERRRQALLCPPEGGGGQSADWCFPADAETSNQVILAGFDMTSFEEARRGDIRNTLAISAVLALLGLAGFVSLFWAQHYRTARRSLQDAHAFADEVVTCLPVGLIATDADGRIAFFNETAETITGIDFRHAQGQLPDDILPAHWCGIRDAMLREEKVIEQEMECTFGTDRRIPVSVSASRIINEEGAFVGNVIILRDLGEIRKLQEELRRTEKLAALGGLAAGVAHEIRNPLSSIKGMASYFGSKFAEGSEDQAAARVMTTEVDRLNRVISELLDFARPSELSPRPVDVAQLVAHSLKLIEQDAEAKNITIEQTVEVNSGASFIMDGDRFSQCLLNLYLNAIQAMPEGGRLQVGVRSLGNSLLQFDITDTGEGIPLIHQQQIFDPYFTTKTKGTGLGLAIVHKIIEAHAGRITVHSQSGHGTRFSITLPAQKTA
jgi:two-component system sensor histidine kinase HydH